MKIVHLIAFFVVVVLFFFLEKKKRCMDPGEYNIGFQNLCTSQFQALTLVLSLGDSG